MKADLKQASAGRFPLRLMPSVRKVAQEFSTREGVSLNQFINLAVAEKLARMQHEQWLARRSKPTPELIAGALRALDSGSNNPPEPGNELPEGYVSIRESEEYKRAIGKL